MRIDRWILTAAVLGLLAFPGLSFANADDDDDDEKEARTVSLPKSVKKSLKAKYPGAKIRGISKEKNEEGETIYEVELTVKTKVDVNFDAKGEVEAIEREIGVFELPEAVAKAAANAFPKGKVVKAETVVEDEGPLHYEVVIEIPGKKPVEVLMAGDGKILKDGSKNAKDDDDDDDDEMEAKDKKGEKKAKGKKEKDDDEEMDDDDDDDDDDDKKVKGKEASKPARVKGSRD